MSTGDFSGTASILGVTISDLLTRGLTPPTHCAGIILSSPVPAFLILAFGSLVSNTARILAFTFSIAFVVLSIYAGAVLSVRVFLICCRISLILSSE